MSGKKHRTKGNRVETEIVNLHEDIGVHAERYPLSGASHFRGSGHDLDIYGDDDGPPLHAEVKARKDGKGYTTIENWLGPHDLLFLKSNRRKPMVVMPWHVYAWFMGVDDLWQPGSKKEPPAKTSTKRGLPGQVDLEDTLLESERGKMNAPE
jgi:Holliday junction resolvase